MNRFALAAFSVVMLFSAPPLVLAQSSTLSAAETSEGWTPLFDGQSLKGWTPRGPGAGRGGGEPPPTGKWAAENGELVWVKDSGRGYLVTERSFTDFVLRVDFFVDAAANSGVNFGVPDTGNISSNTSFEVNIFDDTDQFPTGSINNVRVVLNGDTVVDMTTALHPGGHIGLQAPTAGTTRFRNLRIKAQ